MHNLSYSIRRYFVDQFFAQEIPKLPAGIRILDIGGHQKKKRGDFDITDYSYQITTLNITADHGVDIIGDAIKAPLSDGSFPVLICAEIMEHLYDVKGAVAECYRILSPEGILYLTIPFLYHIHADPEDYGRYTSYFWERVLHEVGFSKVDIKPQGDFGHVCLLMWQQLLNHADWVNFFGRYSRLAAYWILYYPLKALKLGRSSTKESQYTTGYEIVATKQ